jgi:uncharacterized membrane protein YeaQ/YmgE (transglycosylase-associated protein family)
MSLGQHHVITWLIIGFIAGALAGRLVHSKASGCLVNIFVGLAGAFIGGALFEKLWPTVVTGTLLDDIVVSFVGAVILLALLRLFEGRGGRSGGRGGR